MAQTVKYGKTRVLRDPDREEGQPGRKGIGIYYGTNMPVPALAPKAYRRIANVRGACG